MGAKGSVKEILTRTPLFVEVDNLINNFNVGKSPALRFPDDLRIIPLLYSKQIDIQHFCCSSL